MIAARTRTEPATVPAIAPPLIRVMLVDDRDGEGAAVVELPGGCVATGVKLSDEVEDVL